MTLAQLQAKRDEIIARVGVAQKTFGERSVQYSDAAAALALLDGEIQAAAVIESGTGNVWRGAFATFRND